MGRWRRGRPRILAVAASLLGAAHGQRSTAIATASNLTAFTLNKLTSSVTQGIYSLIASCLIVVLAACTDHQTSPLLWAGVVTVVVGGAAYGWFKFQLQGGA